MATMDGETAPSGPIRFIQMRYRYRQADLHTQAHSARCVYMCTPICLLAHSDACASRRARPQTHTHTHTQNILMVSHQLPLQRQVCSAMLVCRDVSLDLQKASAGLSLFPQAAGLVQPMGVILST